MRKIILLISFTALICASLFAQQKEAEKVAVELKAAGLGAGEIEIFMEGSHVFIPALETFYLLGIKSSYDTLQKSFSGFYKSPDSTFEFDLENLTAHYQKRTVQLSDTDYILSNDHLFLNITLLNSLFNLEFSYNPRRLQVSVKNTFDLPIAKVRRILRLAGAGAGYVKLPEPDYYLDREFRVLNGGRLTWNSIGHFSKFFYPYSRHNFELGLRAIGGDLYARLYADVRHKKNKYTWRGSYRYPIFDNNFIQQILVGDFVSEAVVSQEVFGFELTNRPAAFRRLFTREIFQGSVDPKMNVTVSGALSDVTAQIADPEGRYQFDVPVLYGNGLMEIHAYDIWGQERTMRYRMNVPRTLIPPGVFEYSFSFGQTRRSDKVSIINGMFNWGLSSYLTIGSKLLYYNYNYPDKFYPAITTTGRITHNLIFYGSVVPKSLSQAILNWEFPSTAKINFTETYYNRNLFFNPTGILNEMTSTVTLPLFFKRSTIVMSVFGARTSFHDYRNDEIQASISTVLKNVSPSLSTRYLVQKNYNDGNFVLSQQSNASFTFFLPAGVNVRTSVTYDHLRKEFDFFEGSIVKRFSNPLQFSLSYFKSFPQNAYNVALQLTYYFPFARTEVVGSSSRTGRYEYNVNGSGSVYFDVVHPSISFNYDRGNTYGTGGFMIRPFVDDNQNGEYDKGETVLTEGRVYYLNTTIGTRPYSMSVSKPNRRGFYNYEKYNIYLDAQTLDNPLWVPQYRCIQVMTEPYYLRRIDIPVVNGGIIRGIVKATRENRVEPVEGIKIILYSNSANGNGKSKVVYKSISTFSTGEYEFIGVPPGKYHIALDDAQLNQLQYKAAPSVREITITVKPDGDIINDQDFNLSPK